MLKFELGAKSTVAQDLAPYADEIGVVIFDDGTRAPLLSDHIGFFAIVACGDGHAIRAIGARELSGLAP